MRSVPPVLIAAVGLLVGAAVVAILPASALFAPSQQTDASTESKPGERWACPMMDFIGHRPGNCPVCGMKMTKVTAGELTREQQRRMEFELRRLQGR